MSQLYTTTHTPCAVLYFVPVLIVALIGAD